MNSDRVDPITLEVIRNVLLTITSEMKNVVVRTAVSPLWKDAGDVSCAILTDTADLVAQGQGDIPVHLATMPFSMRGILERIPLETITEGDVLIQNDPYSGGNTHLPDVLMAIPVFADGAVVAFSGIRGHWTDVYSATSRVIFEEGLIIPPVKLLRAPLRIRDLTEDDWLNGLWPSAAMLAPGFPGVSRAPIGLFPLQDRAQAISYSEYCHTAAARRFSWTRRRML